MRTRRLVLIASGCLLVSCFEAGAQSTPAQSLTSQVAPNVVTDWALIAQNTIAPTVLLPGQIAYSPLSPIAMYDAVVAIAGGYRPYTAPVTAPAGADVTAAVATAAFRVLRERFPSQQASLEAQYADYIAAIPDNQAKTDGIAVGEAVAWQLLAMRAGDGLETCTGACSSNPPYVQALPGPGVFEPFPPGSTPLGASLRAVRPWTMSSPGQFRPDGPPALTSAEYAENWIETRDLGSSTSTLRSSYDDDTAKFWASQNFFQLRDTFQKAATQYQLDVVETARLFAMGFTASADGVIGCFDAKYHHLFWRPRHAIWRADTDGNPATEPADTAWVPFLPTPNHPEYPAAHACVSYATYDVLHAFFGGDIPITIETINPPGPVSTPVRTYTKFNDIEKEIVDARVFGGMHFRHSSMHGAQLGRKVAKHLVKNFFQALP
jgi:hypothetical protein